MRITADEANRRQLVVVNHLDWARYYFKFPPDENNTEEMAVYNQRLGDQSWAASNRDEPSR